MIYQSKKKYLTHQYMVKSKLIFGVKSEKSILRPKPRGNIHHSRPTQGNKTTYLRINIPNQNKIPIPKYGHLKLNNLNKTIKATTINSLPNIYFILGQRKNIRSLLFMNVGPSQFTLVNCFRYFF